MARAPEHQIVTASDLLEGDVIYFTRRDTWSRHLSEAAVWSDPDAADEALARAAQQQNRIVGAYLVGVDLDPSGHPLTNHFREAFRTRGPSNYFHGKQADLIQHAAE